MRLVVAGGGTGGHLFPGIAIAEAFKSRKGEVLFIGCGRKIEEMVFKNSSFLVKYLPAEGLLGKSLLNQLKAIIRLIKAVGQARKFLLEFRPHIVFGVGGYASVPAILAAKLLRIPTAIHEQNFIPGLANRFLGHIVDKVFVSFPPSRSYFPPSKVVISGNPIRSGLFSPVSKEHEGVGILVTGGSQGARTLNQFLPEVLSKVKEYVPKLYVIHQAGFKDKEQVEKAYFKRGLEAKVFSFIQDMAWAYAQADLVICRAGASTIAEVCALGKPALFIPFPYATHDHQRKNAQFLVDQGAGVMLLEKDLSVTALLKIILSLLQDKERLKKISRKAKNLFPSRATEIIVSELEAMVGYAGV